MVSEEKYMLKERDLGNLQSLLLNEMNLALEVHSLHMGSCKEILELLGQAQAPNI